MRGGEVLTEIVGPFERPEWEDGKGPVGLVLQSRSDDGGETWVPGLHFMGDGYRISPMVCRARRGDGSLCGKVSGHPGVC